MYSTNMTTMLQPSPGNISAEEARATFARDLRFLNEHPGERGLIHQAMYRWYDIFKQATGVDAFDYNGSPDMVLPTGRALGTSAAAFCLLEAQRTAVFLRGIQNAVCDLQTTFPGERIRILYAGCGPFATLLTPLTARFTPQEVGWHLLEVNPASLESAQRLHRNLDLEAYLLSAEVADATYFTIPGNTPFHLVVTETMQRALQNECQVAIALNLIPQLSCEAIFIPQSVSIHAELVRCTADTGPIPLFTYQRLASIYELGARPVGPPQDSHLHVPVLDRPANLYLTTEVQVYKRERLCENDASITLPKNMRRQLHGREHLVFRYQWQPSPRFVCTVK